VKKSQSGTAVEVVSSETLATGRHFVYKRDHVREPGGIEATRDIIEHPGSVVVLPVLDDGRILMIRQFRYAAKQSLWELVAGHREPNETFLESAPRELEEETGYSAKKFTKLLEFYPSPGLLSEKMVVYLAEGLTKGKSRQEEDEKISSRALTLAELEGWIKTGKIVDGKSVAGLLYYAKFIAGNHKKSEPAKRAKSKR
jgi:ADP-ribose pyrophosphatase